jgi:hypothetical protein
MSAIRVSPTDAQKRMVAGRQSFKCANKPGSTLKSLEAYQCPLWQKSDIDDIGSFDQSGFELDHIEELSISGNNSLDNYQALCKSCHSVKTRNFMMKRSNNTKKIYGKFLVKQGVHTVYLADSHIIVKNTKIWSKNRPPDRLRIDEIKNHILKNGYVDGCIYLANIPEQGLVCYDGNHRREALSLIDKSYKIFINVLEDPGDKYLCDTFVNLNKCVPVTDLYMEPEKDTEDTKLLQTIVDDLSNHYAILWDKHRTTSPNPKRPNFNLDGLKTRLKNIIEASELIVSYDNKFKLIEHINGCNEIIRQTICPSKSKLSAKILTKCTRNNCYLFIS